MAAPEPEAQSEQAFRGPPLHLLVFAYQHRLSGTVTVETESGQQHQVYFDQGAPAKVLLADPVLTLDSIILRMGSVPPEDLVSSARVAYEQGKLLGRMLVSRGLITEETLAAALRWQIQEKIAHLMGLSDRTHYRVQPGENHLASYGGVDLTAIDPLVMIMVAARLPTSSGVLDKNANELRGLLLGIVGEAPLDRLYPTPDEQQVLDLLRGDELHSVDSLISAGANERAVKTVLFTLSSAELIEEIEEVIDDVPEDDISFDSEDEHHGDTASQGLGMAPHDAGHAGWVTTQDTDGHAAYSEPDAVEQPPYQHGHPYPGAHPEHEAYQDERPYHGEQPHHDGHVYEEHQPHQDEQAEPHEDHQGHEPSEPYGDHQGYEQAAPYEDDPGYDHAQPYADDEGYAQREPYEDEPNDPPYPPHEPTPQPVANALPARGYASASDGAPSSSRPDPFWDEPLYDEPPISNRAAASTHPSAPHEVAYAAPPAQATPELRDDGDESPTSERDGEQVTQHTLQTVTAHRQVDVNRPEVRRSRRGSSQEQLAAQRPEPAASYPSVQPSGPHESNRGDTYSASAEDSMAPSSGGPRAVARVKVQRQAQPRGSQPEVTKSGFAENILRRFRGDEEPAPSQSEAAPEIPVDKPDWCMADFDGLSATEAFAIAEESLRILNYPKAEAAAAKAVSEDMNNGTYRSTHAWIQAKRKGSPVHGEEESWYADEIAVLTDVLVREPNFELAYYYRARVYKSAKKMKKAIEDFEMCTMLNPGNIDAARELKEYRLLKAKQRRRRAMEGPQEPEKKGFFDWVTDKVKR